MTLILKYVYWRLVMLLLLLLLIYNFCISLVPEAPVLTLGNVQRHQPYQCPYHHHYFHG